MDNKIFWNKAANWGFTLGVAIFAMSLVSWWLKWEQNAAWAVDLYYFVLLVIAIYASGKRNLAMYPSGYTYGRSVGFIFAMLLFAGIVAGVGAFLLHAYIAPDYYSALLDDAFDKVLLQGGANDVMIDAVDKVRPMALGLFKNPFYCIFNEIINLAIKGGLLGLVLAIMLHRREPSSPFENE